MKTRMNYCVILCLTAGLLLAGCRSTKDTFVPVTGGEIIPIPARVEIARSNVLNYLISSAPLENFPSNAEWQLDKTRRKEGEYRFVSGDWLLVIWPANARDQNERVIVQHQTSYASWCGYVRPDGQVVDTSYMP